MLRSFLLITLAAFTLSTHAQILVGPADSNSAFLFCVSQSTGLTYNTWVDHSGVTTDANICGGICYDGGYRYTAFAYAPGSRFQGLAQVRACYCSNDEPPGWELQPDTYQNSPGGTGSCDPRKQYKIYLSRTTYSFRRCVSNAQIISNIGQNGAVYKPANKGAAGCAANCVGYPGFLYRTYTGCGCLLTTALGDTTDISDCGINNYQILTHTPNTAVGRLQGSALVARKRRQEGGSRKRLESSLCPHPFTACNVPGTSSYECLDTATEVESCGGCMYGRFGNSTAAGGIDCSTTVGSAGNAVPCREGHCVAL